MRFVRRPEIAVSAADQAEANAAGQRMFIPAPSPRLDTLRAPMQTAAELSLLHDSAMDQLAAKHQLWMQRVRTDYRGDRVEAWTREPPGATGSQHLAQAARDAHNALDRAVHELTQVAHPDPSPTDGWPPDPTVERATLRREPTGVHHRALVRRSVDEDAEFGEDRGVLVRH